MEKLISGEGARFKGKLGMAVRKSVKDMIAAKGLDRDRVIESLPSDVRWFLTERYVATQWYSLAGADELLETLAVQLGEDARDLARAVGRDVAFNTAGRVGRTVIGLFGSPERVARYLDSMWAQLYDGGRIQADYDEKREVLSVRRGSWAGHAPLVCVTLLGSLESIAQHMRGVHLLRAERTACISGDDVGRCHFELRFRQG